MSSETPGELDRPVDVEADVEPLERSAQDIEVGPGPGDVLPIGRDHGEVKTGTRSLVLRLDRREGLTCFTE